MSPGREGGGVAQHRGVDRVLSEQEGRGQKGVAGGLRAHMLSARSSFGVLVLPTNEAAAAAAEGQGHMAGVMRQRSECERERGREAVREAGREGKPLPQNSKTRAYL